MRAGMFLTFLSTSFVALALLAQAMSFGRDFLSVAALVLAFDLVVGLTTFLRMNGANLDDLRANHGMARIRHAYTQITPIVTPYFTTPTHDDIDAVTKVYGPISELAVRAVRVRAEHLERHDRPHRVDDWRRAGDRDRDAVRRDRRRGDLDRCGRWSNRACRPLRAHLCGDHARTGSDSRPLPDPQRRPGHRSPAVIRRWLYAGGTRQDRLRDPDAVVAVLDLRPGMVVGDLGPGAGHFTVRMARAVEPDGLVYALDASQGTLDDLRRVAVDRGITTLRTVLVRRDRLEIPEPVDLLFVSATYHHLPKPVTYFAEARAYLKPGARVVILESRREGLLARWWGPHATSPRNLRREMADAGYRLSATHDVVRGYWFGMFEVAQA